MSDALDWPLFGLRDDVRPALVRASAANAPAVLATLYRTIGGAPRGVGAQMVFYQNEMSGFLSGGCIEADLALHATRVLQTWSPAQITYGSGGPVDIRLSCGSRIDVLLEPIGPNDSAARALLANARDRRPATWLSDGSTRACVGALDQAAVPPPLRAALASARSRPGDCGFSDYPFAIFRHHTPPLRLLVIGDEPVALAVVKLSAEMEIATTLIRPKGPETCPLEGVDYNRDDVEAAIAAWAPDPWTAIAVITHQSELEHAALKTALATRASYVGALGSRRRVPERDARLIAAGVSPTDAAKIRTPIGLPDGGKAPWQIAVSIVAEISGAMAAVAGP